MISPTINDMDLFLDACEKADIVNITSLLQIFQFDVDILMGAYYITKKRAHKLTPNLTLRKDLPIDLLKNRQKHNKDKTLVDQGLESAQCADYIYTYISPYIDTNLTLFAYILCKINHFEDFYNFVIIHHHSINFNYKSNDGKTMLHMACKNGNVEMVECLLSYNVNLDQYDYLSYTQKIPDKTALHYATKHLHYDIVSLLIKHKANMNVRNYKGRAPLHYVAPGPKGNKRMFELLLSGGADINLKYKNNTLLYYAVDNNHYETVKYLLDLGANAFIPCLIYRTVNDQFEKIYEVPLTLAMRQQFNNLDDEINNFRILTLFHFLLGGN